jgi:hypothetical protein
MEGCLAKKRGLTSGERELLREVFRGLIDYDRIRLQEGPGRNPLAAIALRSPKTWAMTYLDTIHFAEGHFRDDFSAGEDSAHKALLVHEAAHVWQYRSLGLIAFALRYGWNFIACEFNQDRLYVYDAETDFGSATLEAQAQMVSHSWSLGDKPGAEGLKAKLAKTGLYGL